MAGWQFSFPPSRSCLWDSSPTGPSIELHISRSSWTCIQVSLSAVQLAVRHARQSPGQQLDCLLIGSAWITEGEGVAIDVDRFDPGRPEKQGNGVVPTAVIPGDIAIPCQVVVSTPPHASYLTHNLVALQRAMDKLRVVLSRPPAPVDPTALLSIRMHCTCSEDGILNLQCGCVTPSLPCRVSPLHHLPIVQTALARNLTGPLPLSTLQGRAKHGYLTMELSRKLVLLLHSDPKTSSLPLVGVWVSGVGSVRHPLVWAVCVSYCHSTMLRERVWGEEEGAFLLVIYSEGSNQPTFWECVVESGGEWEVCCGEAEVQLSSSVGLVPLQLHPVPQSSALHTLLVAASHPHTTCDAPLPSPRPTHTQVPRLNSDAELSCLSLLAEQTPPNCPHTPTGQPTSRRSSSASSYASTDKENTSPVLIPPPLYPSSPPSLLCNSQEVLPEKQRGVEELLRQQEQQLRALQEQVNDLLRNQSPALHHTPSAHHTPTSDASTTTGESLIRVKPMPHSNAPHPPMLHSPSPDPTLRSPEPRPPTLRSPSPEPRSPTLRSPSEPRPPTLRSPSPTHTCSDCSSIGDLSVRTGTSLLSIPSTDIHLDLQSYAAQSSCPPTSPSPPPTPTSSEEDDSSLLFRDQQKFYQNMMVQVNELLHPSCECPSLSCQHPSSSTSTVLECSDEMSILPVPRIMCGGVCGSVTEMFQGSILDEQVQLADMIALKYLNKGENIPGDSARSVCDHTLAHMSMATQQYLQRHHLVGGSRKERNEGENVLDIRRLKTLPKLL